MERSGRKGRWWGGASIYEAWELPGKEGLFGTKLYFAGVSGLGSEGGWGPSRHCLREFLSGARVVPVRRALLGLRNRSTGKGSPPVMGVGELSQR